MHAVSADAAQDAKGEGEVQGVGFGRRAGFRRGVSVISVSIGCCSLGMGASVVRGWSTGRAVREAFLRVDAERVS